MVDLLALNCIEVPFSVDRSTLHRWRVSGSVPEHTYKLVYYYSKYKFEFKYPFLAVDLDDVLCLGVSNEIK